MAKQSAAERANDAAAALWAEHEARLRERLRTDSVFVLFLGLRNGMTDDEVLAVALAAEPLSE